jgi:uncharacterized membrane protein YgcG
MQGSTNVQQTPGRRAGRGSRVLLAVLAMLLLSLFAILEGDRRAQAIVGGETVQKNTDYPFMVQVLENGKLVCTGTLLDNNSVLTAAHCVTDEKGNPLDPSTLSVIVGTTKNLDTSQGQKRGVATKPSICCDPSNPKSGKNYNPRPKGLVNKLGTPPYDAAVLTLNRPVKFGPNVQPVQLATPDQKHSLEQPWSKPTVLGWGYTSPWADKTADFLQKVKLPILPDPSERKISTKEWPGKTGKGACHGDSGGPLIAEDKPGKQIGITSNIEGGGLCGLANPEGYTEVNNPTIYNFITKEAGLASANQGGNKGGGNQGGNKGGGGNQGSGGNQGGGGSNQGEGGGTKEPAPTEPAPTEPAPCTNPSGCIG